MRPPILISIFVATFWASFSQAYPLNGFERTKISRLEGFFYSLQTPSGKENFAPGALLSMREVNLKLLDKKFPFPVANIQFSNELRALLGTSAEQLAISVLDLSDPSNPLYGSFNDQRLFIPGSAAKVVVALALFQALADAFPKIEERVQILRDPVIVADDIIISDSHNAPFWDKANGSIEFRPIRQGDSGNLWTYLDWMLSASSNAAGSIVLRELLLLAHFKHAYPPASEEARQFIYKTPKAELAKVLQQTIASSITRSGLNPKTLYHASLFTENGKRTIPAAGSSATTRELAHFLLRMEQGALVDNFSSLELKRLLYVTQRRIRYASAPILDVAALYFKSGSLQRCKARSHCRQYYGDGLNVMNSLAIVESPASNPRYHYIVTLSSNTPGVNSAAWHVEIAQKLHRLIEKHHAAKGNLPL